MKKVKIEDYGTRYSIFRTITAGESRSHSLHIPEKPTMKHSFTKMLWLVWKNPYATRKQIFEFALTPMVQLILSYGYNRNAAMNPTVHDYWAELFRYGYIEQWKEGRAIKYCLTDRGKMVLMKIPQEEKNAFGLEQLK